MKKQINLSQDKIGYLLSYFAIPSIIAFLVNSLYNIVDQIFIGQFVGPLGNAATTIMFPFITITIAFSMVVGNGAGALFSLKLGQKNYSLARRVAATTIILLIVISVVLFAFFITSYKTLLILFGATGNIMPYAIDYTKIIILGIPFTIIINGMNPIIRADGSPRFSMYSTLIGAIINTILDPIFIHTFNLGIKGAGYATIVGQFIGFILTTYYILFRFKSIKIDFKYIIDTTKKLKLHIITTIISLGISSFFAQAAITLIQIIINNSMKYYGRISIYGADIPIASTGIAMKVSSIMFSIVFGITIGAQPILGYNYGARKYDRVIKTLKLEIFIASLISAIGCIFFVFFPELIIPIFGKSDTPLYNDFLIKTFKIYLSGTFVVGFNVCSSFFFKL